MQRKIKIFTLALVLAFGICSLVGLVSCTKKPVENVTVTISQKEIQLEVGETQKLTVKVEPADAQDKTIEWKSSDESVATVKDGEVTAIAEGEATITVTTNQKSDTCKVTVKAKGETPNGSNSGTESGAGSNSGSDSVTNSGSDSTTNSGSDSATDSGTNSDSTSTDSANGSQDTARRRR